MRAPDATFRRARQLRRAMSLPEVVLWQRVRKGRLAGLRVRRQHPIGPYILDFYCPAARLALEVDGLAHDGPGRLRHDRHRDAWLAHRRVKVLHIQAADVLRDERLEGVIAAIIRGGGGPLRLAALATSPPCGGGARP